jgi:tetratricopeptide (TPR) repeat protein
MAGRDLSSALFQDPQPAEAWRQSLGLDALEQQHGLPAGLLTSVLRTESSGNPAAFSPKGAEGLFQFMPQTAKQYGINPYDPQEAAQAAAQELGRLHRKYNGNIPATLAGWNWGQGNLEEQGRYSEAEPLYRDALALCKRLLGEEHPSVAVSLNNLAGLYANQGQFEKAAPLLEQALRVVRQLLGEEHPSTQILEQNLEWVQAAMR